MARIPLPWRLSTTAMWALLLVVSVAVLCVYVCVCVSVCARSARMGSTAKKKVKGQKKPRQTRMGQSLGGISAFESSATQDRMTGAQRRLKCPVTQKFHEDAPVPALVGRKSWQVRLSFFVSPTVHDGQYVTEGMALSLLKCSALVARPTLPAPVLTCAYCL